MSRALVAGMVVAFSTPLLVAAAIAERPDGSSPPPAAAAGPRPATPPAAPPRGFEGTTAQKAHIGFRVSADGSKLDGLRVTYSATCEDTLSFELDDKLYTPIAVRPDGTFSKRLGDRITLSGRIEDGRASGTLRVKMLYGIFSCSTPTIRWTAEET